MAENQDYGILATSGETFRRRLHYERASIGVSGSWNPDSSFGNIKDNDYTDILNLRMQTIGGYECRTGYDKYTPAAALGSLEVLAKCEYRHKVDDVDVYFDISVYQVEDKIRIQGINRGKLSTGPWSVQFTAQDLDGCNPITDGLPSIATSTVPPQIATCTQYGVYIVISVFGVGTWVVYPNDINAATWSLRELGKKLTVTPWRVTYADSYDGDLFLTLFEDKIDISPRVPVALAHHFTAKPLLQGSTPDPRIPPYQYVQVPMGATYRKSSDSGFDHTEHKFFVWDNHDFVNVPAANPARSTLHLRKAGWGYRFIMKRSFADPRGNTITYRSQASVDIWVNDTVYCPPQVYDVPTQPNGDFLKKQQFDDSGLGATTSSGEFIFLDKTQYTGNGIRVVENPSDMEALANKYIRYYGQNWVPGTWNSNGQLWDHNGFDEDLLLPSMVWAGYRWRQWDAFQGIVFHEEYNFDSTFKDAWFTEVPASLLASAPLCTFNWTDFSTTDGTTPNPNLPSDATEIEIYRTAWTDSDAKLSNNDPAFQPHLYGYVGSLKKDGSFTDNVKDEEIDFALTPDNYDGYLEGQFSGQVVREYSGKVALGNCSTSYYVFNPVAIAPFIIGNYNNPLTSRNSTDIGVTDFYYLQYVDTDGNSSELVQIPSDPNNPVGSYSIIAFPLPSGYDPSIVTINVWYSHFDGTATSYYLIAQATPTDNQAVVKLKNITGIPPKWTASIPSTKGSVSSPKVIQEGGEVIWSNVNEPFDWPPLNARVVRKTGNITAMETVVGELMIFSDTTIDYDNLNTFDPRGEEVSKWVGCVGRSAICKVDKVVFIMTANGLYFAEPGGVVSFPANVQSVVLEYIREEIKGKPPMLNARRATIGYDGKRYELWVHFPSSQDLVGIGDPYLPEITIIYKFFNPNITQNTVATFVNYRFDLLTAADNADANPFTPGDLRTWNQPILLTTSDGKLFCSYKASDGSGSFKLQTIDCDVNTDKSGVPVVWPDRTVFEHVYGMGEMNIQKQMRELQIAGDFDCTLTVRHGAPNPLANPDPTYGWANPTWSPAHTINIPTGEGYNISFPYRLGATATGAMKSPEMYATAPVVRFETAIRDGVHIVTYKGLDLLYQVVRNHPL